MTSQNDGPFLSGRDSDHQSATKVPSYLALLQESHEARGMHCGTTAYFPFVYHHRLGPEPSLSQLVGHGGTRRASAAYHHLGL